MGKKKRKKKATEADGLGKDVLDDIMLTPAVVETWHQKAMEAAKNLSEAGHDRTDIGLETAFVQDDGSLLLRVEVKGGQAITMRVAPGQWGYKS